MIGADEQSASGATDDTSGAQHVNTDTGLAAARWIAEHGDVLWRFALGRTRSHGAAEEVIQDTIIAAMQGFNKFAGRSSERTWLLAIAAHKATDYFRKQHRTSAGDAAGNPHTDQATDATFTKSGKWAKLPKQLGRDSGSAAEDAELLAALRDCIDLLPPGLAEAIWLRDLLDVPADEVCKAAGLTPTNLWTRTHRARSALRLCMEKKLGISSKEPR